MKTQQAVIKLAALAQDSRLTMFRLLVQQGPDGLPAGTIAARLRIAPATLSFHLKALCAARLLRSRPEGRFIYYSADYGAMNALLGFLTANCCGGVPGACVQAAA